jgi:hypothetical protein
MDCEKEGADAQTEVADAHTQVRGVKGGVEEVVVEYS